MKKDKENEKKSADSQKFFVPLQKESLKVDDYGTDNNRRAEEAAAGHIPEEWRERLGLHSVAERGRPSLHNRWDTLVYEEGLWSDEAGDQLGNQKPSVREESKRLIEVARKVGDYIPSTIWETFGSKVEIPSAESVVFTDESNGRVVKFKDPFVIQFKDDSHLEALYLHHVHNRFFGNVPYRFLGVSQDPNYGGVRFVFEQQFVDTISKPSTEEITKWFNDRGFHRTEDKFWFTDGIVSFTDILDNDNCLKDKNGNLRFIDAMIKLNVSAKEMIARYMDLDRKTKEKLDYAGIGVGSRFRVTGLNSFNDFEVKRIDYGGRMMVFGPLPSNTHPDYQREFEWPIERVLENIRLNQGRRWVQTDEDRNDLVLSQVKAAILERVNDPSSRAVFSDDQIQKLNHYTALFSDLTPKKDIFMSLLENMKEDFRKNHVPQEWIDSVREELSDLADGKRQEQSVSRGIH